MLFNRGISGNTLRDLEKRWEEDVIGMKPDVLSVLVGTNDVHYYLQGDKKSLLILKDGRNVTVPCLTVLCRPIRN